MARTLTIPRRFRGPDDSGNGGWTAGALAALLPAAEVVEVTLRRPPPLDRPLAVQTDESGLRLLDGADVVAQAAPVEESLIAVPPVSLAEATAAAASYPGLRAHPFPGCFACGPARPEDPADPDAGLRIFPGQTQSDPVRVAAPWTPAAAEVALAWAALDCVGGWAGDLVERPMVLGRITARLLALPEPGQPHVVVGEARGVDGRKVATASSLYGVAGRLIGVAAHVWIRVDPASFGIGGSSESRSSA